MQKIGRLEEVPVRELWKHEEYGFSAWLEQNLDLLSEKIGMELSEPEREKLVGKYQCDLVATGPNGNPVIVENQLESTDHDHLGKLLTYLSNLEAKTAIWIATSHRTEHIKTIQWLNENSPDDVAFIMVKLSAFRISGSDTAAPLFTVIVGPSDEAKDFGKQKKELAERHVIRRRFWESLLKLAKDRGILLHAQRSPSIDGYLGAGAGYQAGVSFNYLVWLHSCAVELYINTAEQARNEAIFNSLQTKKSEIEGSFGTGLGWDFMPGKQACRVRFEISDGGLHDEEKWPDIQSQMVDRMDALAKALRPFLP